MERKIRTIALDTKVAICGSPIFDDICVQFCKDNNFEDITLSSFGKNMDLHLSSYAWLSNIVAKKMAEAKKGSIILLSSIYGLRGQDMSIYEGTEMKENMSYSIIKGVISNLVKQMAFYFGKYGVRINAVCPGGFEDDSKI